MFYEMLAGGLVLLRLNTAEHRRLVAYFLSAAYKKERLIVHLFSSTVDKSGKAPLLGPAKILIRKDFVKPRKLYSAWPERIELETRNRGGYLEVTAPETRIHQIVVIEQ